MGFISHPVVKYLLLPMPQQDVINVVDQHEVLGDNEVIKPVPRDLIMIMCQRIEGTVLEGLPFDLSVYNCPQSLSQEAPVGMFSSANCVYSN